jgi:hypothetical protein
MNLAIQTPQIEDLIHTIRGEKVILDSDLARIYGVATFRFNEAVKRNESRFPPDFRFQLTPDELNSLTSQIAISKPRRGGRRTLPYAFTEHGAIMAANILNSPRAVQMSIYVIRAYVKMRTELSTVGRVPSRGLQTTTRTFLAALISTKAQSSMSSSAL